MEKSIIPPVERALLKAELTKNKLLRKTNKANNEIYIFTAHTSPNLMLEVGRLRELSFRDSGGGTGNEIDTDEFDYMKKPYTQLIVWDPQAEEILGGYRFIHGSDVEFDENGQPRLSTAHMYHFTEKFNKEYMPYTLELGRSFVQPDYQSSKMGTKSLFALDNLWDGLGALSIVVPDSKYYFGKFTMYPTFNREARNMILYYIQKYFPDHDNLVYPIEPMELNIDYPRMETLFSSGDMFLDYKFLNKSVRSYKCNIPPLVNAYVNLSPTMKNFGCAVNHEFAEVEETCILVTIADIFEEKRKRYIETFLQSVPKNVIRLMRNRWIKRKFRRKPKNTGRPQIL
ncbi:MAG: GNAT family N-acetyltransferase [Prevotellaceae bacterium]|jgi:hypothetical protein|nr:GNAT family N-acetyltransferase [Prevotellaceae bacterium]